MHAFSNVSIPSISTEYIIYMTSFLIRITGTFSIEYAVMVKQFNVPEVCSINDYSVDFCGNYRLRNKKNDALEFVSKIIFAPGARHYLRSSGSTLARIVKLAVR